MNHLKTLAAAALVLAACNPAPIEEVAFAGPDYVYICWWNEANEMPSRQEPEQPAMTLLPARF